MHQLLPHCPMCYTARLTLSINWPLQTMLHLDSNASQICLWTGRLCADSGAAEAYVIEIEFGRTMYNSYMGVMAIM